MRVSRYNDELSVRAIAGTHVVLFGLDVAEAAREDLLGFAIRRQGGGLPTWLRGGRVFAGQALENGRVPGSHKAPIQAFVWGDYAARPGTAYTYTVQAVHGSPGDLRLGEPLEVPIETESVDDGKHGIIFNRGVAGSQAYSRLFGRSRRYYPTDWVDDDGRPIWRAFIKPEDVLRDARERRGRGRRGRNPWHWLSRGLEEELLAFIRQAKGSRYALRGAVYEFDYAPVIQAFVTALESGADVKIVYHAKSSSPHKVVRERGSVVTVERANGEVTRYRGRTVVRAPVKDEICQATEAALDSVGVRYWRSTARRDGMMIERANVGRIAHNKFIVLLRDEEPQQVWTGSTNFTAGGIFGQSNVGHVIRDEQLAARYLEYWEALAQDPPISELREWTVGAQPDLAGGLPPPGTTVVFSPRTSLAMLQWYGKLVRGAKSSVHLTAAFGVGGLQNDLATAADNALRYVMMESRGGTAQRSYEAIRGCEQNRIAWGEMRRRRGEDDTRLVEGLTGLNEHVSYVHTKYMLIDPLSEDPTVVTGSANFSQASTVDNDENMLIIRGNERVADIFLGEYMRLFNHFWFRNRSNELSDEEFQEAELLCPDDSWTRPYFQEGTQERKERLLFRAEPTTSQEDSP